MTKELIFVSGSEYEESFFVDKGPTVNDQFRVWMPYISVTDTVGAAICRGSNIVGDYIYYLYRQAGGNCFAVKTDLEGSVEWEVFVPTGGDFPGIVHQITVVGGVVYFFAGQSALITLNDVDGSNPTYTNIDTQTGGFNNAIVDDSSLVLYASDALKSNNLTFTNEQVSADPLLGAVGFGPYAYSIRDLNATEAVIVYSVSGTWYISKFNKTTLSAVWSLDITTEGYEDSSGSVKYNLNAAKTHALIYAQSTVDSTPHVLEVDLSNGTYAAHPFPLPTGVNAGNVRGLWAGVNQATAWISLRTANGPHHIYRFNSLWELEGIENTIALVPTDPPFLSVESLSEVYGIVHKEFTSFDYTGTVTIDGGPGEIDLALINQSSMKLVDMVLSDPSGNYTLKALTNTAPHMVLAIGPDTSNNFQIVSNLTV